VFRILDKEKRKRKKTDIHAMKTPLVLKGIEKKRDLLSTYIGTVNPIQNMVIFK